MLFIIVQVIYITLLARPKEGANNDLPLTAARIPARVPRHSLTAPLFHRVMVLAMFALRFTAFLPKVGVRFDWVRYHLEVLGRSQGIHFSRATCRNDGGQGMAKKFPNISPETGNIQ